MLARTWSLATLTSGSRGKCPALSLGSSASCLETAALRKVMGEAPAEGDSWEPRRNEALVLGLSSWPRSRPCDKDWSARCGLGRPRRAWTGRQQREAADQGRLSGSRSLNLRALGARAARSRRVTPERSGELGVTPSCGCGGGLLLGVSFPGPVVSPAAEGAWAGLAGQAGGSWRCAQRGQGGDLGGHSQGLLHAANVWGHSVPSLHWPLKGRVRGQSQGLETAV